MKKKNYINMFKFAVIHWYNYRKQLSAEFLGVFDDFEEARKYAFSKAEKDAYCNDIITEDEIKDPNKLNRPYKSIVGYGGSKDGYITTFYSVIEWFDGFKNDWIFDDEDFEMVQTGCLQ